MMVVISQSLAEQDRYTRIADRQADADHFRSPPPLSDNESWSIARETLHIEVQRFANLFAWAKGNYLAFGDS